MMDTLRKAGATQQVAELASRASAGAALTPPFHVAYLLNSLRRAGATQQVAEFASRVAAGASLRLLGDFGMLWDGFREAGATEQATQLLDRLAAAGRSTLKWIWCVSRDGNGVPFPRLAEKISKS